MQMVYISTFYGFKSFLQFGILKSKLQRIECVKFCIRFVHTLKVLKTEKSLSELHT